MITFWTLIGLLTLVMLLITFYPLLRGTKNVSDVTVTDYDALVYKSQLEEVDRDEARGELNEDEAAAVRIEISRRLLSADAKQAKAEKLRDKSMSRVNAIILTIFFAVVVTGGSLGIYLKIGSPGVPNMAFAERTAEREAAMASRQMPEIEKVEEALIGQLKKTPDHFDTWMELAGIQMQLGKFVGASTSFAEAMRIDRDVYGVLASYGEAMVLASQGTVSEEIREIFLEAGQKFPDDPRPKFYISQFEYQKGDPRKALSMLVAMIREAPAGAEWVPAVRSETLALAKEAGIDISDELPTAMASNDRGPTTEDMANAANMTEGDRSDMISGMVDQLATRLKGEPDDIAGWRKLARAAGVLGREDQIVSAYDNIIRLEGETVALQLDKADALMEASKGRPTPEVLKAMGRVLAMDPNNPDALWFSAMAALSIGNKDKASLLFDQALNAVGEDSSDYNELRKSADMMLGK